MADFSLLLKKAPSGWNDFRLGDICTRVQGNYQPDPNGTRLYLGLEHLAQGLPMMVGRGNEADVKSSKNAFQPNDVLFGKLRPYLRKCVLMQEEGVCSTDILVFRANYKVLPQYLCYLCHTDQFIGHAKATTSGVQHPRTSWNSLSEFRLTLPPTDEQRRIAHVLTTVQTAIEQQARMIALTRELKSALMRKLFTEGMRGEKQKETEIGLVPESWDVKPLKQHCDVVTSSLSYTQLSELEESNDGDVVELLGIKVSDMNLLGNENRIVTSNLIKLVNLHFAQKKAVQAGTIVFPKRGAAIATNKKRLTTTWTVFDPNLIGVKPKQGLDTGFIYYWFQRFDLRRITDPGPTPQLNKKDLEPLQIPIPKDFDEQVEIAGILDTVEKKIELLSEKQSRLEELFRMLLHQLMTGQTRVNEIDLPGLS
jgi:type I restriction enzyme S subunit